MMKLMEFTALVQNGTALINFLIRLGIFLGSVECSTCGAVCNLDTVNCQYRCQRRSTQKNKKGKMVTRCNFEESARIGTFLHGRIGIQKMALFVGYFLELPHLRVHFMQREMNLSLTSVIDWSNYCREVCMNWAYLPSLVEVSITAEGYSRDSGCLVGSRGDPEKYFYFSRENRRAETLVDLIKKWIEPGTTIMSDCWKSYDRLEEEGFQHLTVNHSHNFVDPDSGANTQSGEKMWRDVRDHIPKYGRNKEHFVGYISEYVFKRNVRTGQRI